MRLKIKKRRVGWLIRKCTSLTRKWNRKPGLCRANWKNLLRKPSKLLYLTTNNLRFHFKIAILTKCYYVLNNCYNLIKGAKCLRNCGAASVGEYNKIILVLSTEFQSWRFKHQPWSESMRKYWCLKCLHWNSLQWPIYIYQLSWSLQFVIKLLQHLSPATCAGLLGCLILS